MEECRYFQSFPKHQITVLVSFSPKLPCKMTMISHNCNVIILQIFKQFTFCFFEFFISNMFEIILFFLTSLNFGIHLLSPNVFNQFPTFARWSIFVDPLGSAPSQMWHFLAFKTFPYLYQCKPFLHLHFLSYCTIHHLILPFCPWKLPQHHHLYVKCIVFFHMVRQQ